MFPPEPFTFQDHKLSPSVQWPCGAFLPFPEDLSLVMLSLRSVPRDDSGFSVARALHKASLCLPGEFLDFDKVPPDAFLRGLVLPPPHQPPSAAQVPAALTSVDFVFVCEDASIWSFSQLYHGPFKVLARSSKFFTFQMGSRTDTVSINRLKPFHGPDLVVQPPPHQGWPPRLVPVAVPGPVVLIPVVPAISSRLNPPRRARFSPSSP